MERGRTTTPAAEAMVKRVVQVGSMPLLVNSAWGLSE